jgi:hypothetical protein
MTLALCRRGLLILALLATSAFVRSSERTATPVFSTATTATLDCGYCRDINGGGWEHTFDGAGALFDCHLVNACHGNWQTGICSDWHCGCNAISCPLMEIDRSSVPDMTGTARHQLLAVTLKDAAMMRQFIERNRDLVVLNRERGVIQLIGCGARIVAQAPVDRVFPEAME